MINVRASLAKHICGVPEGLALWKPEPNRFQRMLLRFLLRTYGKDSSMHVWLTHPLIRNK